MAQTPRSISWSLAVAPPRRRVALLALVLAAAGCGGTFASARAADGAPSRGAGGIWRAVFGTRGTRARLQWRNVTDTPGPACRAALGRSGVSFSPLSERSQPGADGCGIAHPVRIVRGPTGISYQPALLVECSLALLLPELERIVQEEARASLRSPVRRIDTFGTYSCRAMRGWASFTSEHSFGNAIDIAGFATADGRLVTVARDFRRPTPEGAFLRRLHHRLRAETHFSYVLGPDHDAAHHNHFHVDRGVRWTGF